MTSLDKQIGDNLARLRTPRMSQRALAELMTEAGWKWSHVTVGSIEHGDRPLRVAEAIGVASILEVSVDEIVNVHDAAELRKAQSAVMVALDRLQAATSAWDNARLELAVVADLVGYEEPEAGDGVSALTVMPFVSYTAEEVVHGLHHNDIHGDLDRERAYWESRGSGKWTQAFIAAEVTQRGEHSTTP